MADLAQSLGWIQFAWEAVFAVVLTLLGIYSRHIGALRKRQWELESALTRERELSAARCAGLERDLAKTEAACLKEAARRSAELEKELARLEAACLKSSDLSNVHRRVDDLTANVHDMAGEVRGMRGSLQAIQQHLIEKGGK